MNFIDCSPVLVTTVGHICGAKVPIDQKQIELLDLWAEQNFDDINFGMMSKIELIFIL